MLPPEAIEEFNQIYEKHFKRRLEPVEAEETALRVYNFFKTIIRPVEESTKLADEIPGQESEAERKPKNYVNKKKG